MLLMRGFVVTMLSLAWAVLGDSRAAQAAKVGGSGRSLDGGVKVGAGSPPSSNASGTPNTGGSSGVTSSSARQSVYEYFQAVCAAELAGTRPPVHERIVCRALTQLGLCDRDRGAGIFPRGQVDYTFGNAEAWCSEFVSFNYLVAGLAMKGGDVAELPWLLRNVPSLRSYFSARSVYFLNDGSQVPQAGDWLELREGQHSGVAMGVVGSYLVSIEGNVGGCVAIKVRSNFSDASRSDLVGWGSASGLAARFLGGGVKLNLPAGTVLKGGAP